MTIVDTVEEASPGWVTDALRAGGVLGEGSVVSVAVELMSVGQLGLVARLTLSYEGAGDDVPSTVMLKLPSLDPGSRQIGVGLGVYEAEVRFYQSIAPTVSVPAPQMYWGDIEPATGRFSLLIEDLALRGEPGDMIAGGTVDQAAGALGALVGLQAPRWSDPALADHAWLAAPERNHIMFAGVEPALPLFLERFAGRLDPAHVALVERIVPKASAWAAAMGSGPTVVVHGDFRMDNIVFGPSARDDVWVFDWQAARVGPPLIDACVYLGGCLALEERRARERELLREYHDGLTAGGVDGFSFDEVWESYRWCVFYGLMLSVPFSVQLERTERGDELFAGMVRGYAQHALDLDSESLLPA